MHTEGVATDEEREDLATVIKIMDIEKRSVEKIKKNNSSNNS